MNKHNLLLGLFLSTLIFLCGGNAVLAFQERAREATLIKFKGEVKIKHDGKEGFEKTVNNLPLFNGDVVMTRDKSFAQISFTDGSTIILQANSNFYISHEDEEEGPITLLVLVWGYLRARVSPKSPGGPFMVETANAIAAVGGTSFSVGVALDGTTRIGVEAGQVEVRETDGSLTLQENQEVTVDPPSVEEPAQPLPQEYKQQSEEDWMAWRIKIEERFFQNPVAVSQRMARRMEWALAKERELLKKIDQQTNQLNLLLEEARKARRKRDWETLKQKRAEIKALAQDFRKTVLVMRRMNNRLTAFFELGQELGRKSKEEKERLGDAFAQVRANFKRIKDSAHLVRLAQQEARRIIKERLPRLRQQRKDMLEEK